MMEQELLAQLVQRPVSPFGKAPFLLPHDTMYVVRSGYVDVFTVKVDDGERAGPRIHAFRAGPDDALFGVRLGDDRVGLLAVCGPGTQLLEIPLRVIEDAWRDQHHRAAVVRFIDRWVALVYGSLASRLPPSRVGALSAGTTTILPAGAAAEPGATVCWVQPDTPGWRLMGEDAAELSTSLFMPIVRPGWIDAPQRGRADVVETIQLAGVDGPWPGLAALHGIVTRRSALAAETARTREGRRMVARAVSQRSLMAKASAALVSSAARRGAPVGSVPAVQDGPDDERDPLFAALQIVAEAASLRAVAPAKDDTADHRSIERLLAASRLRARRVALREDWWRRDHGPLLASVARDRRPVALVWSSGGYRLHDPADGSVEAITAERAATLSPFAQTVYRPFPDVALTVRDLARFGLHGCRRDLQLVFWLAIITTLLGMVPSIATSALFNTIVPGARRFELLQVMAILLSCALCTALFTVARGIALLRIEGRMGSAVQSAVWDRLLCVPLAFFRDYTAGDLAMRAMSIDAMRQILSTSTIAALLGGILSIGNLGLMFYYSVPLAWRATLLIGVSVAVTAIGGCRQLRPQRALARLQTKISGLVLQLLSSIGRLRVSGAETAAFALWADRFSEQRRLQFKNRTIANWVTAFHCAFPVAAQLAIFWTVWWVLPPPGAAGAIRTGDFLGFLSAFSTSVTAILATCGGVLNALAVVPLYEQARPILQALPEVHGATTDPGRLEGRIEINHARFRYHADGPLVLRDVSLQVRPGEFVAVVGPSGSGKSTLLRILLGFEKLESGSVYFDGREITGLDVHALRRQLGVVLQSGRLMAGDILTNIVASGSATIEDAWESARMAGFADDIKAMPMGMHTIISDGGGTLSGGQRQRLMIARALVYRPRILFFDEATSALDNRTQATVSASLEQLRASRIVVAHRLSTIVNADRIYAMDRGQIVQTGSYAELMRQGGLFATIARRQIH